jgi:PA14 domain
VRPTACLLALVFCVALRADDQEPVAKFGTTVVLSSGLCGLVYHIRQNTDKLPNFRRMKPVGTIYTTSLNIPAQDFQQGFPGVTTRFEWFAIDYSGKFWIEKPAAYEFALTSDDGSKLYIDDEPVVDNDGVHPAEEKTGSVDLSHGVHRIRVSYFQGPRFHLALVLKVAGPGEKLRIFSTDEFKPPPNPESWSDMDSEPVKKHRRNR